MTEPAACRVAFKAGLGVFDAAKIVEHAADAPQHAQRKTEQGGIADVGVVAGVGLGVIASNIHADAVNASFQSERADLAGSANDFATGANVAYVAGGVLLVTGVVMSVVSLVGGEP